MVPIFTGRKISKEEKSAFEHLKESAKKTLTEKEFSVQRKSWGSAKGFNTEQERSNK